MKKFLVIIAGLLIILGIFINTLGDKGQSTLLNTGDQPFAKTNNNESIVRKRESKKSLNKRIFYYSLLINPKIKGLPLSFNKFSNSLLDSYKAEVFYNSLRLNPSIKGLPSTYNDFAAKYGFPFKLHPLTAKDFEIVPDYNSKSDTIKATRKEWKLSPAVPEDFSNTTSNTQQTTRKNVDMKSDSLSVKKYPEKNQAVNGINTRLAFNYVEYASVVILTLLLFSFFSRKIKNFWKLLLYVLLPTWLIMSVIQGMGNKHFDNSYELYSLGGFTNLLAETLPLILIFGGITFGLKYKKIRKSN